MDKWLFQWPNLSVYSLYVQNIHSINASLVFADLNTTIVFKELFHF